jgi:hypothetical protein
VTGRLSAALGGKRPPGIYRWRSRAHPEAVRRELVAAGWALHLLDGRTVLTAPDALDAFAEVLAFPAWYGRTFDALADCLGDLSWLPAEGHVLIWDQWNALVSADAKGWRQAYDALSRAVETRQRAGVAPFYLLLRGPGPAGNPEGRGTIPIL